MIYFSNSQGACCDAAGAAPATGGMYARYTGTAAIRPGGSL